MAAVLLLFPGLVTSQQPPVRVVTPTQRAKLPAAAPPIEWSDVSASYPLAQPQQAYAITLTKVNTTPPTPLGYFSWTPEGGWHWRLTTSWTKVDFPPQARGVRSGSKVMASKTICGWGGCGTFPIAWAQSYYVAFPAGSMSATTARTMTQPASPVSLTPLATLATDPRAAPVAVPTGVPVRESEPTAPYAGSWTTLSAGQQLQLDGGARTLMLEGSNLVLRTSAGALVAEFPANALVVRFPDYRVEVWTFVGSKPSGPG